MSGFVFHLTVIVAQSPAHPLQVRCGWLGKGRRTRGTILSKPWCAWALSCMASGEDSDNLYSFPPPQLPLFLKLLGDQQPKNLFKVIQKWSDLPATDSSHSTGAFLNQ